MNTDIKYPHITVELVGQDGNVFNLIGLTVEAMRDAGITRDVTRAFTAECMQQPSYDAVLQLILATVNVT